MPPKKQYGLIKRNKKPETKLVAAKLSFFDDGDSVKEFKNIFIPNDDYLSSIFNLHI